MAYFVVVYFFFNVFCFNDHIKHIYFKKKGMIKWK